MTEKANVRILVVDDEDDIRAILKSGLENEGFLVDASGNPEEVVNTYEPGKYDLLLTDIRMPGMNGFELYRAIRNKDPKVKVCFITAFDIYYDEFKRVFPKLKVSCFIKKPVTIGQLASVVREELARPEPMEEEPALKKPRA